MYFSVGVTLVFNNALFSVAAPVGRIVKFWGTPLLTAGGLTYDYTEEKKTCDSEFHMVVSVGPMSFRGISHFLLKIMRE